jgi:hypothetical protein
MARQHVADVLSIDERALIERPPNTYQGPGSQVVRAALSVFVRGGSVRD